MCLDHLFADSVKRAASLTDLAKGATKIRDRHAYALGEGLQFALPLRSAVAEPAPCKTIDLRQHRLRLLELGPQISCSVGMQMESGGLRGQLGDQALQTFAGSLCERAPAGCGSNLLFAEGSDLPRGCENPVEMRQDEFAQRRLVGAFPGSREIMRFRACHRPAFARRGLDAFGEKVPAHPRQIQEVAQGQPTLPDSASPPIELLDQG